MLKIRLTLLWAPLLAAVSGCAGISYYAEPAVGPRANIRVFANGALVKYYPAATCFSLKNPGGGYAAGVKHIGDMPLRSDAANFTELYVKAGEPMAISFDYARTKSTLGGYAVKQCGPIGFSFIPAEGENYEAAFLLGDGGCDTSLQKIVKDESGGYRRTKMKAKNAYRCSAGPKSGFKRPEGWDDKP